MTKKEWLKEAQYCLDKKAAYMSLLNIWHSFLKEYAQEHDCIIKINSHTGEEFSFTRIMNMLEDYSKNLYLVTTKMQELSKGLIHSVPDDMEIKDPMGMFE